MHPADMCIVFSSYKRPTTHQNMPSDPASNVHAPIAGPLFGGGAPSGDPNAMSVDPLPPPPPPKEIPNEDHMDVDDSPEDLMSVDCDDTMME